MKNSLWLLLMVAAAIVVGTVLYLSMGSHGKIVVRIATTTSLYDTGLLEYLAKVFEERYPNVELHFMREGTGKALRKAEAGDACLVLVHAPNLEQEYISKGVLEYHRIFAYNYFVIVGPRGDPAGVRNASSAIDAFKRIYRAGEEGKAKFVSRGDLSGTHIRELIIWSLAGLDPRGKRWYIETGKGMGETLIHANEVEAYTLSDIGTFLGYKVDMRVPNLELLYTNSTELINVYSAYLVSSCTGEERRYARMFIDFLVSREGQELIVKYGVEKYGRPLFYPVRGKEEVLQEAWQWLAQLRLSETPSR